MEMVLEGVLKDCSDVMCVHAACEREEIIVDKIHSPVQKCIQMYI